MEAAAMVTVSSDGTAALIDETVAAVAVAGGDPLGRGRLRPEGSCCGVDTGVVGSECIIGWLFSVGTVSFSCRIILSAKVGKRLAK